MAALGEATLALASPTTGAPGYDRSEVSVGIVHFGVGGFSRAHQGVYLDTLLGQDSQSHAFGLCGVNILPNDRQIVDAMRSQDCLYTALVRNPDGSTDARIVGSMIEHRYAPDDPAGVLGLLADPAVRVVTMTITEGGYFYSPSTGEIDGGAAALRWDAENPAEPSTAFGYIVRALDTRRRAGIPAFTVLSCDNIHGNGAIARRVVVALAERIGPELAEWIDSHVSFPNSMVDRITPRTTPRDVQEAEELTGLADAWPVTTEPFTQWVIEDRFTMGRPEWEQVGVELVEDVRPYELMKMRLLNAGHQTISYAGRLLGYEYGFQACRDDTILGLLTHYQIHEAAHTLEPIPGTDFTSYSESVRERFANPQIRDTIERLTFQSSTMTANYVLPVIRDLLDSGRDASAAIAVIACWARFLEGRDEAGVAYAISDPRADEMLERASRHDDDLLAVIRDNPSFEGLSDRSAFTGPYAATLGAIRTLGVRRVLNELVQAPPPGGRAQP